MTQSGIRTDAVGSPPYTDKQARSLLYAALANKQYTTKRNGRSGKFAFSSISQHGIITISQGCGILSNTSELTKTYFATKFNAYMAPTQQLSIIKRKGLRKRNPLILLVGLPGVEPGTNGL
jgi:hypothetical protein